MKQRLHLWYDQEGDFLELCIGKPSKAYAEEIEPGIFVRFDELIHDIKSVGILSITQRALPLHFSLLDLHLSYDHKDDILDFYFGKPTNAVFEDIGDGVLQRVEKKTGDVTGLKILHLTTGKKKFIDRELFLSFEIPRAVSASAA